jgi:hypothetical protein
MAASVKVECSSFLFSNKKASPRYPLKDVEEEEKETDEYSEEEKGREKEYRRPFGVRPFYLLARSSSLYNWTKQLPVGAAPGSSISYCLSLGLNAAQMTCSNV